MLEALRRELGEVVSDLYRDPRSSFDRLADLQERAKAAGHDDEAAAILGFMAMAARRFDLALARQTAELAVRAKPDAAAYVEMAWAQESSADAAATEERWQDASRHYRAAARSHERAALLLADEAEPERADLHREKAAATRATAQAMDDRDAAP
ncbi:MAG: hypothetical protein JNL38_33025 [Myxococcales bacterium]|nr:hypothetical protein [Myxococcales bacterium]